MHAILYFFPNVNNKTQLITIIDPNPFDGVKPICYEKQFFCLKKREMVRYTVIFTLHWAESS